MLKKTLQENVTVNILQAFTSSGGTTEGGGGSSLDKSFVKFPFIKALSPSQVSVLSESGVPPQQYLSLPPPIFYTPTLTFDF